MSESYRLLLVPSESHPSLCQGVTPGKVLSFPHPKSGQPIQFLLLADGELCELQSLMPSGTQYGSYLVEQRIVSNGSLYAASVFDPKFLLLPVLEKHKARFSPLEQILAGESVGLYMQLRGCRRLDLGRICDVNDQLGDDMILYRLDVNKVIAWLSEKVKRAQRTLEKLESRRLQSGVGSAFVQGFNPTDKKATTTEATEGSAGSSLGNSKEHIHTAIDLVCEHLNDEWTAKVMEAFKVDDEVDVKEAAAATKRAAWEQSDLDKALEFVQGKRAKTEGESSGAAPAAPKQTLGQKRLEKVDKKGMRSISSFFGGGGGGSNKKK